MGGALDLSQCESGNDRHRKSTLFDIYRIKDEGRAINALSLPSYIPLLLTGLQHAATNLRAYSERRWSPERDQGGRDRSAPVSDLEWWLVALFGAQHEGHVDAEGASTAVEVVAGLKWWAVFTPTDPTDTSSKPIDAVPFGRTGAITINSLNDILQLLERGWGMEALLMEPGYRLHMRSNTPHAVMTLSHSICLGAHYFSLSTMQDHFIGMVTTLVDPNITNTEHAPFRHMIRLIIQYVYHAVVHRTDILLQQTRHIMDPENLTLDDLPDLLAIIYTGLLSNATDPLTYKLSCTTPTPSTQERQIALARMNLFDSNAMPDEDRAGCSLARSCAYELRNWLSHHYDITGAEGSTTADLVNFVVAHQASMIYAAHLASPVVNSSLIPECLSPDMIKRQIIGTFEDDDPVQMLVKNRIEEISSSNAAGRPMFVDVKEWTITKKIGISVYVPLGNDAMSHLGVSPNDRRYLDGAKEHFAVVLGPMARNATTKGNVKVAITKYPDHKDTPSTPDIDGEEDEDGDGDEDGEGDDDVEGDEVLEGDKDVNMDSEIDDGHGAIDEVDNMDDDGDSDSGCNIISESEERATPDTSDTQPESEDSDGEQGSRTQLGAASLPQKRRVEVWMPGHRIKKRRLNPW